MNRLDWRAIRALVLFGWRKAKADHLPLAARGAMHAGVIVIFWHIFQAAPLEEIDAPEIDAKNLTWYLALTEWVIFSAGVPFREIEADIQDGALEIGMGRPMPYGLTRLNFDLGAVAYRLLALGLIMLVTTSLITTSLPPFGLTALLLPFVIVLATTILLLFQLPIGYAAIWFGSSAPIFWVFQKLLFVLGGLILPLSLYPEPLAVIAVTSPFAAILSAPGHFALGISPGEALAIIAMQLYWLIGVGFCAFLIERAVIARMQKEGI